MFEPSTRLPGTPEPTPAAKPCHACGGEGAREVRGIDGSVLEKAACGACLGTGERRDGLSKVLGQPSFDLKK